MVALCRALLSCSLKESRALFQFEYPVLINASLLFCVCCFPNRRQEKQKVEFKFTEYSNHSNVSNQFFWKAPNFRGPKTTSLSAAFGWCSTSKSCCLSLSSVMYQSRVTSLAVCYFSTINEQYNFFYSLIKSDDNCFSLYKTENTGNE